MVYDYTAPHWREINQAQIAQLNQLVGKHGPRFVYKARGTACPEKNPAHGKVFLCSKPRLTGAAWAQPYREKGKLIGYKVMYNDGIFQGDDYDWNTVCHESLHWAFNLPDVKATEDDQSCLSDADLRTYGPQDIKIIKTLVRKLYD